MATKIISITTNLSRFGGAQKVLMDVHEGIRDVYDAKIIGFQKFETLHPSYGIQASEYVRLTNPFYLNDKILIVHARNVMAIIMVLKRVFFLNTQILYVAHNVYGNHRNVSFFPRNIISISKKVTENLLGYFKLKNRNIQLIYNGIKDDAPLYPGKPYRENNKIIILYSARVNEVKRQLQIVDQLADKLDPAIEIHFAGAGPDFEQLSKVCAGSNNFKALGFIKNIHEVVSNADYLMLFSVQEGLPISLIEGVMHGKPLLVNDVGGNLEIGVPGFNGIELKEDWSLLADTLNSLVLISPDEYATMSRQSRAHYENMFTYQNMVTNYLSALKAME
jgi:glycosyltransferase involved in cell wall biosynthesis